MSQKLAVIIAAANDESVIESTLKSVTWADEIIVVVASISTDATTKIAKKYTDTVFTAVNNLGLQRNYGIQKSTSDWILILDTDEIISSVLQKEIETELMDATADGYLIPYKNYFLGHVVSWGNQRYEKLRLFKKNKGTVENLITHPEIKVQGRVAKLKGKIDHYSFRSIRQILTKFTYYGKEDVERLKLVEKPALYKLITYPVHMFKTLFLDEKGYKDGIWGCALALCFAYYEFTRQWFLLLDSKNERAKS